MSCVFCYRKTEEGIPTKYGLACDDFCATKMLCVFCNKVILNGLEIFNGLCDRVRIDGIQTNYGRACSDFCAAGGFVVEAMKCELKETPCIGHDKRLCTAVHELKAGATASDNIEALKRVIMAHIMRCTNGNCAMPHTLASVSRRKSAQHVPEEVRPLKRQLTVEDLGHVLRVFRAKYVPLSHQREFTMDLKSTMRTEGYPELEGLLDQYNVKAAPESESPVFAEV